MIFPFLPLCQNCFYKLFAKVILDNCFAVPCKVMKNIFCRNKTKCNSIEESDKFKQSPNTHKFQHPSQIIHWLFIKPDLNWPNQKDQKKAAPFFGHNSHCLRAVSQHISLNISKAPFDEGSSATTCVIMCVEGRNSIGLLVIFGISMTTKENGAERKGDKRIVGKKLELQVGEIFWGECFYWKGNL